MQSLCERERSHCILIRQPPLKMFKQRNAGQFADNNNSSFAATVAISSLDDCNYKLVLYIMTPHWWPVDCAEVITCGADVSATAQGVAEIL